MVEEDEEPRTLLFLLDVKSPRIEEKKSPIKFTTDQKKSTSMYGESGLLSRTCPEEVTYGINLQVLVFWNNDSQDEGDEQGRKRLNSQS